MPDSQDRSAGLREKLVEAQEARLLAEESLTVAQTGGQRAPPPLLERANAELEGALRAAQAEQRALREELVSKGTLLVDVGSQLSTALDSAAAAEARISELEGRLREAGEVEELLMATEAERDRLAAQLAELQQQAAGGAEDGGAAPDELRAEVAALREENSLMAAELGALSPQFFEEVEDMKYALAVAREQLAQYEQAHGPLEEG